MKLKNITLSSGDNIQVGLGVNVIVGPNNAGKSSILRELDGQLKCEPHMWSSRSRKVVDSYELSFPDSAEELLDDIDKNFERREPGQYNDGRQTSETYLIGQNQAMAVGKARGYWGSQNGLGQLGSIISTLLNAESRLGLTNDSSTIDSYREKPVTPLQIMYRDRSIEQQINSLVKEAFGVGLVINRYSGSMIHFHVGEVKTKEEMPATDEYNEEINKLPLVSGQGDGMRAFIGMVMSVLTGQFPVILIDEPEAFLHPPQARMFGRFLAQYATPDSGTQVIIATHSEDILAGLTSVTKACDQISLIRITRTGTQNHIRQLDPHDFQSFSTSPMIKYYNMLKGLFSSGTVLCEGDSDCTYFRATVDAIKDSKIRSIQEAHFTHTGGKARISSAIDRFQKVAIPTAAIFDIDIIQNEKDFSALVKAVGANDGIVQPLRNTVISAIKNKDKKIKRTTVKLEVNRILDDKKSEYLLANECKKIAEEIKSETGWKQFKTAGTAILSGDALIAFNNLCDYMEKFGVFILKQGELERLHSDVPQNDKAQWLSTVINEKKYRESPAIPMLERISEYLAKNQSAPSGVDQ